MDYTDRYGKGIIIKELSTNKLYEEIKKFESLCSSIPNIELQLNYEDIIKLLKLELEQRNNNEKYYQEISKLNNGKEPEEIIIL